MKPRAAVAIGKIPYIEREAVILEFCSCHYVWSEGKNGEIIRHERLWRDPRCPLHGNDTKEAPW